MDPEPEPVTREEYTPNATEKVLAYAASIAALPTLLPMTGLMILLGRVHNARSDNPFINALLSGARALLFLAVFVVFCATMVIFIPYMLLLHLLAAMGIVRIPPDDEEVQLEEHVEH